MRAKLDAERRRGMQKREESTKQALDARNSIYEARFASIPQSEKVFSDSTYQSLTPPKPYVSPTTKTPAVFSWKSMSWYI